MSDWPDEPEIRDPVVGRDYMSDSSPVPARSESAPVADRERVAEALHAGMVGALHQCYSLCPKRVEARRLTDALFAAGVFRSEAAPGEIGGPPLVDMVSESQFEPGGDYYRPRSEAVALDREAVIRAIEHRVYANQYGEVSNVYGAVDAIMALARPEAVVKAEALEELVREEDLLLADRTAHTGRMILDRAKRLRERADELEGK